MIITVIGSMTKGNKMLEIKKFLEQFDNLVNIPVDDQLQKLPLLEIQKIWIKKIEEADLVVVIPKELTLQDKGGSKHLLDIGESTSYEIAIALYLGKKIVIY